MTTAAECDATQDSLAAAVVTQKSGDDLVRSSLQLLVDIGGEADAAALRWRRVHEFSDGREDGGDRLVVVFELVLELLKRACFSDYRSHATSEAEAYHMIDAGEHLRRALADQGYAPR